MKHDILTTDLSKTAPPTVNHPLFNQHPAIYLNLRVSALVEEALQNGEGVITDTGAIMCDTGKFTGRSPKDKFIVYTTKPPIPSLGEKLIRLLMEKILINSTKKW